VFLVKTPYDLPVNECDDYDYIIAWSVFHHINPDNWKNFLDGFSELLKTG
jgi:cyclopropane fatty-acyl-phospholipid synthase-like methyltransferase